MTVVDGVDAEDDTDRVALRSHAVRVTAVADIRRPVRAMANEMIVAVNRRCHAGGVGALVSLVNYVCAVWYSQLLTHAPGFDWAVRPSPEPEPGVWPPRVPEE